jgi:subtilisin-like proprotein convertase family protein
MSFSSWLRSWKAPLARSSSGNSRRRSPTTRPQTFRPGLEALEERTLLTGGWVSASSGVGVGLGYLALDAQDNSYVAGQFSPTVTFGSTTLSCSQATQNGFIAKYAPDGSSVWARDLGGSGYVSPGRVAVDAAGNVYEVGQFEYTATFGTLTLSNAGTGPDAFLAKLDPSGNFLWVRQFGVNQYPTALAVAVDGNGNVYAGGGFYGTLSFGNGVTVTSGGFNDAYVVKLDSAGNALWARDMGGGSTTSNYGDSVRGMTTDPAGNVYATGMFFGTGTFGSTSLTSKGGGADAFVTRLDSAGNFQWAQRMGGDTGFAGSTDQGRDLAIDSRSADPSTWAVYVVGDVGGNNVDIGATTFAAPNGVAYVAKLDATTGSFTWADHFSSSAVTGGAVSIAASVGVDGAGNVYSAGGFYGTTDFDPGPGTLSLTPNGRDAFVSELDPNGNFLAAWQTRGGGGAFGLATEVAGGVWVSGSYGTTTFPTGQSATGGGVFVMRMNTPNGAVVGSAYIDVNNNGVRDAGEPPLTGGTVYADLNNNGVRDAGEPSATTDSSGNYQIGGLAAGSYAIRLVLPSGWTATAGSSATVSVGNGTVPSVDLGAFAATTTRTYANNTAVKTSKGKPNAISTLVISDVKTIYDLQITLSVSNTQSQPLTVTLLGPDGTQVTLIASTNINGTVTYHAPSFAGKKLTGKWTLEVDGLAGGTLNSWSLSVLEPTT